MIKIVSKKHHGLNYHKKEYRKVRKQMLNDKSIGLSEYREWLKLKIGENYE